MPSPEEIVRSFDARRGEIVVGDGLARVETGPDLRFLGPADAATLLTAVWENPPEAAEGVLGMLVPALPAPPGAGPWAVTIAFDPVGHVPAAAIAGADADALAEGSGGRHAGWVRPPHYDPVGRRLSSIERLRFPGNREDVLNWDLRLFGRRGILRLKLVAGIALLPVLEPLLDDVAGRVAFLPGHRAEDFDPGRDPVAAGGGPPEAIRAMVRALPFRRGDVVLADGAVRIGLGDAFVFLEPADARRFLDAMWGGMSGGMSGGWRDALGLVLPADADPAAPGTWIALVRHVPVGHVDEAEATSVDFTAVLAAARPSAAAAARHGPAVVLEGWDGMPRWEADHRRFVLPKRLRIAGRVTDLIDVDAWFLGRTGMLHMKALVDATGRPALDRQLGPLLDAVAFAPGHRHGDFMPGTDPVASQPLLDLLADNPRASSGVVRLLEAMLERPWLIPALIAAPVVIGLAWKMAVH